MADLKSDSLKALPDVALELVEWDWRVEEKKVASGYDIEAHYLKLLSQPLDAGTVDDWLAAWSHLKGLVGEALERLYVSRVDPELGGYFDTLDTADQRREDRYNNYLENTHTPAEEHEQELKKMLLKSGLEPEGFAGSCRTRTTAGWNRRKIPIRNLRAEAQLFREANLPLLVQEKKVASGYDKIIGAQTAEFSCSSCLRWGWEGETITLPRLYRELEQPDRGTREKAWRIAMDQYLADRPAINCLLPSLGNLPGQAIPHQLHHSRGKIWKSLFKLRSEIAASADQPDYRAYAWQDQLRLEYSPDDCLRFHGAGRVVPPGSGVYVRSNDAIEAVVVPAASRILDRRRATLQLDSLRPWDMQADRLGLPPLEPFSTAEELIDKASSSILSRQAGTMSTTASPPPPPAAPQFPADSVDPELGGYFDTMNSEGLLDLDNREGKAPGGYAEYFLNARRPFIYH